MTSYAGQKGRAAAQPRPTSPVAPKPITLADEQRAAANKQFILEHMPELLPTIREFHAEGLIDGWRAVKNCTLNEKNS